jgi:hypothetical protein
MRSAAKAPELRDLHEYSNVIQIGHFGDCPIDGNVILDISA